MEINEYRVIFSSPDKERLTKHLNHKPKGKGKCRRRISKLFKRTVQVLISEDND